jgi:TRAP-type C4-dicarboxylate transport system permease small subunit
MATVGRWLLRLFSLLALVLFAALGVIFGVVTVDQFGAKEYVTDNVAGLPPVWVISALLVIPCLAFVAGFWLLFMDSFKGGAGPTPPEATQVQLPRSLLDRLRLWRRAH